MRTGRPIQRGSITAVYEDRRKVPELSGQNQFQVVYYHRLGTPQSEDEIIYADPLHPLRYYDGFDDGDTGKYLFVSVSGRNVRYAA